MPGRTEKDNAIQPVSVGHLGRTIGQAYALAASLDQVGMGLLRLGLVIVLLWIGALKFAQYEADGIVPMVANSPVMNFFYEYDAPDYRAHMNREGELVPANRIWHQANGTYTFSIGLGVLIMLIGLLIAAHPIWPKLAVLGSLMLICMACTTLSFLITTPEAWVPALGGSAHGFPFLSGMGRLIVKDAIMLGAAVITLSDSARTCLRQLPE